MLSLVQSLVPPVGAYNLGKHRNTVEINQEKATNRLYPRDIFFALTIYMNKRRFLFLRDTENSD